MRCSICGIQIDSVDEAVEKGWTPHFYDLDQEYELACPSCTEALLEVGQDGEMKVKDEYSGKIRIVGDMRKRDSGEHLLIGIVVEKDEKRGH